MATGKRFYWIKLTKEFMIDDIDFLMSQNNGAAYVVLYEMLCLATINTGGACAYSVGEAIIPYDIEKIKRECRYFDEDTIIVALELFKKLGWVYKQDNGVLRIADFNEKVGSETDWARKKARQRLEGGDNVPELSPKKSPQRKSKNIEKDTDSELYNTKLLSLGAPACAKKPYGSFGNVMLTDEEYASLKAGMPDADRRIEIFSCKLKAKGYRYEDHYATILLWWVEEQRRQCTERGSSSFNVDEFFEAALRQTYGDDAGRKGGDGRE